MSPVAQGVSAVQYFIICRVVFVDLTCNQCMNIIMIVCIFDSSFIKNGYLLMYW